MNNQMLNVSHRMPESKARELRRQGYIPGVIYGTGNETIPVIFDKKTVDDFLRNMEGNAIFEVNLEGDLKPVRLKQVQRDPVSHSIIHMDLQNINMDEKIKAKVPIRFEGAHEIERRGMVLQHQKSYVELEGLAKDIPSHITIPAGKLIENRSIRILDLELAEELSIMDSPDDVIASALKPSSREPQEQSSSEDMPEAAEVE